MIGILVVSHGRLAEALISSVQSLVGHLPKVRGVSIWPKGSLGNNLYKFTKRGILHV